MKEMVRLKIMRPVIFATPCPTEHCDRYQQCSRRELSSQGHQAPTASALQPTSKQASLTKFPASHPLNFESDEYQSEVIKEELSKALSVNFCKTANFSL